MSVFVETSMFYAALDRMATQHDAGRSALSRDDLVTSDHVLVESWNLIQNRLGEAVAETLLEKVQSDALRLEFVQPIDVQRALAVGQAFPDQGFSLVDRTSFALMERLGISRVATLDRHFAVYRYGPKRDRAFELVR